MNADVCSTFDLDLYDKILSRGLSKGLGSRDGDGMICIEAALCMALGLPHGDNPGCVALSVRSFKIALNDSAWSSPQARAAGLYKIGLAQLGSLGVVDDREFASLIAERTIRIIIPKVFREVFKDNPACLTQAALCETEGTADAAARAAYAAYAARAADAAYAAARAAYAAYAADAAARAAYAAYAARAADAAYAAARAADAAAIKDEYLNLSAQIALDVLIELNSPGVKLLDRLLGRGL